MSWRLAFFVTGWIVHLGNAGRRGRAEKTAAYAQRFPSLDFVGIDLKRVRLPSVEHSLPFVKAHNTNWLQVRAEFEEGLDLLPNGSVGLFSSEFALGHYPPELVPTGRETPRV
jgi:hypothetical protein